MTLALPLIVALLSQQGGFFNKVVPNPTDRNGYEEYVRAAELAMSPAVKGYFSWQPRGDFSQVDPKAPPAQQAAWRALIGKTPLQAKRQLLRENGRILDLIRKGNEKPVFSPRAEITNATLFPELTGIRAAARVAVACSDALLADGRSAEAIRVMGDTLKMGANVQDGIIISYLVGVAVQATVLGGLNDQLDRYSEVDWRSFVPVTSQLLEQNQLPNIMRGEAALILKTVEDVAKDRKLADALVTTDKALAERVRTMSSGETANLIQDLRRELDVWVKDCEAVFRQNESKWRAVTRPTATSDVDKLIDLLMPSTDQTYAALTRIRTQLRLLRLHALVQIYRWNWSELPGTLDVVASRAEIFDPLTETPFNFERTDGGYRIYSKGSELTGEIELRYNGRQRNGGRSTDPPR